MKKGRDYHGFGEEYNVEKVEVKQFHLPYINDIIIILRLLGRIPSGKGDRNFGEENQDFKTWGWGRISSCRELYTPLNDNSQIPKRDTNQNCVLNNNFCNSHNSFNVFLSTENDKI